jgi:hypothetical protein
MIKIKRLDLPRFYPKYDFRFIDEFRKDLEREKWARFFASYGFKTIPDSTFNKSLPTGTSDGWFLLKLGRDKVLVVITNGKRYLSDYKPHINLFSEKLKELEHKALSYSERAAIEVLIKSNICPDCLRGMFKLDCSIRYRRYRKQQRLRRLKKWHKAQDSLKS